MSAFKQGVTAFKTGAIGNPHPVNTDKNRQWEAGFNKAFFDNLDKVKKREARVEENIRTRGRGV